MTYRREKCDACNAKIPKHQPLLFCDICSKYKHLKCEKLTKSQAKHIISTGLLWTCSQCIGEILPINATENSKIKIQNAVKVKVKCASCPGYSYSLKNVKTCQWCDGKVHAKCWKGELGCKTCCESMYPGYYAYTYELNGIENCKNNLLYNPYSSTHFTMQLGNDLDNEENANNIWNDISDFLVSCKYKQIEKIEVNSTNELNLLSLNIRHLRDKIDQLRENVIDYQKFDILCFNECNLIKEKLPNGLNDISLEGFHEPILQNPYRASGKGGGLAIYINTKLCNEDDITSFNPNPEAENKCGEFQFIKIKNVRGSKKTHVIGNVYRSPSGNPENFNTLFNKILQKLHRHTKNKTCHIVGDFNQDLIKYDSDSNSQNLVDYAASNGFVQLVARPTRVTESTASLIDQVYTNNLDSTLSCNILTVDLSDHLAIHTKIKLCNDGTTNIAKGLNQVNNKREFRIFNEANNEKFKMLINEETWDEIHEDMGAQEHYDKFTEIYMQHYNSAYPLKTKRERRKNERQNPKPWILPWLEDACARKKTLYHKYIKEPSTKNKTVYDKMNDFCKKHVKLAKAKYYKKYFEDYNDNSRKQWDMINTLLNRNRKRGSIKKMIDKTGNIASTPSSIAEHFNDYFTNIASNMKGTHDTQPGNHHQQFVRQKEKSKIFLDKVWSQEIFSTINSLKNKATLDTKINALKIANTSLKFTETLADAINKSFKEGIFPYQLKSARVVPVYKEGIKTNVENYRPISLLSSISKIYEKLMHSRIIKFLDQNNSLNDMQYGFRPGRSCESALLKAQDIILDSLHKQQVSLLLLIDFSKAFDMVDHNILLDKLKHYGIRGTVLKWFQSYLSDRTQFVTIDGLDSDAKSIKHGVPQGSILGPLLFIIYINDLPNISELVKIVLYADDANIIITGKNITEVSQKLKEICNKLIEWVDVNGLRLNLKKTKYIIFTRKKSENFLPAPLIISGTKIEQKHEVRFLGVIVDENLTWKKHINTLHTKMSRYIGIMYKLKQILPLKARIQIFHSFVQSQINYCSLVWGFSAKSYIEI